MSKADYKIEGTVPRELLVSEVRKAARQFAMQFFHFSKVLYDQFGLEKTKDIVRQTVFELAVDRSDQLREKALAQGLKADSVEDFMSVIDLPSPDGSRNGEKITVPMRKCGELILTNIPGSERSHRFTVM